MFSLENKFLLNIILLLSVIFFYNLENVNSDFSENHDPNITTEMVVIKNDSRILEKNLSNNSKEAVVDKLLIEELSSYQFDEKRQSLQQLCRKVYNIQHKNLKKQKQGLKKESRRMEKMQQQLLQNIEKHRKNIQKRFSEQKEKLKKIKKEINYAMLHLENIIKSIGNQLDSISRTTINSSEEFKEDEPVIDLSNEDHKVGRRVIRKKITIPPRK